MGQKKLNLPATPSYYQNPLQQPDTSSLSQTGHDLIGGNFGGNLSWLQPTMNVNNGANALSAAQGMLQPQFRDTLQQINNQAAANNQLNSSTYTDALARSQSDLNSQYQSIVSNQAIADANQSNQNRLNLFGTGINTLQGAIGNEQQDTGSQNAFNQQNYENQVGAMLANRNPSGGFAGALTGGLGGALGGFAMGGPGGALAGGIGGALAGGFGSQSANYGGQIAQAGAGAYGASQNPLYKFLNQQNVGVNGSLSYTPGSAASNDPFGQQNNQFGYSNTAWNPKRASQLW